MDTFKILIAATFEAASARHAKAAAAEYIRTIQNHGADEDLVYPDSIEVASVANLSIPYAPDAWSDDQRAAHLAESLEEAFHKASCLAGGWYRRAVAIDMQIDHSLKEHYAIRPTDAPAAQGWRTVYSVEAHN